MYTLQCTKSLPTSNLGHTKPSSDSSFLNTKCMMLELAGYPKHVYLYTFGQTWDVLEGQAYQRALM